ncbi:MAG: hypothetical protein JNL25_13655 [Rhodospirillaceae bacterium]|nr:hypothetical protein [Rhodospirillaceae bacterium]
MNWINRLGSNCGLGILVLLSMHQMAAAEEETIKAFSAWQGRGQIFDTGPERATFVGSFTGIIFVETEKGPLDAGHMTCPAIVDLNLKDGTQEAKARCTITAKDGARVYSDLTCAGVQMVGCDGEFTFTGGTDRFAGITGGGPVTVRSGLHEVAVGGGNIVQESAGGIIIWPKLQYRLAE